MKAFLNTKIFISYSRKDEKIAVYIFEGLKSMGYDVFYDKEKILIGDDFSEKIKDTIGKMDGFIAIISNNSMKSEWCKAEMYSAMASNKKFIPVHYLENQSEFTIPKLFPQRLHHIIVKYPGDYINLLSQIHKHLSSARKKVLLTFIKKTVFFLIVISFSIFTIIFLTKNINDWNYSIQRKEQLQEVENSTKIYNQNQIKSISSEFQIDKVFYEEILNFYSEEDNPDVLRINSLLILNYIDNIVDNGEKHRWYLNNINWRNNRFLNGNVSNITFREGTLEGVNFLNSNINYTIWGNSVSNVLFKSCHFSANYFSPITMISVDYENCTFNGGELDLKNMADVHFYYKDNNPTSSTITNELALFENIVIKNCIQPPRNEVIEILEDDSEVQFTGVLFEKCYFQGFIRPSWFKNCTFSNCVFPADFDTSDLLETGSIIQNNLSTSSSCF